jgi:hypothetical protein
MSEPDYVSERFSLEDAGTFLQPHFERIESHTLPGTLRFPSAQPFMGYFASARAMMMAPEHTDAEWLAVLDYVQGEVDAIIEREGRFDVSKITGALVGTKGSK